jgi:beta-lactam-binding protein with PASTA domain
MGESEQFTVVPTLVGLTAATAHDVALDAQVLAVDQDPAHSPTVAGVVTEQRPAPGSQVSPGQRVLIWVSTNGPEGGGGGGGGNLPAPPKPTPLAPAGAK